MPPCVQRPVWCSVRHACMHACLPRPAGHMRCAAVHSPCLAWLHNQLTPSVHGLTQRLRVPLTTCVTQALGGSAAEVPKLATAADNLRTAGAILILRANSKNESEALIALHNVSFCV